MTLRSAVNVRRQRDRDGISFGRCGSPAGVLGNCAQHQALTLDFERTLVSFLLIRVPDTNAVQESSVIRHVDCRLFGVWQVRWYRTETLSPTIREGFHATDVSAGSQISDQSRKRGSRGDPEKDVGGPLPLRRPRLVGVKTQSLRLVLKHRKNSMTL
jgi:hypothetical protein